MYAHVHIRMCVVDDSTNIEFVFRKPRCVCVDLWPLVALGVNKFVVVTRNIRCVIHRDYRYRVFKKKTEHSTPSKYILETISDYIEFNKRVLLNLLNSNHFSFSIFFNNINISKVCIVVRL